MTNPKPAHIRAAKTLCLSLTADCTEGWAGLAKVLQARLTADERAKLAEAALGGAGVPVAAFTGDMTEAGFWADLASRDELKSYVLASFNRLTSADQSAFLAYVKGKAA